MYISIATSSAMISSPLTRVPTPSIRKRRKKVMAREIMMPLLELSKISARNKNIARKKNTKKRSFAASCSGFVAKTIIATTIHKAKSRKRAG
jgi:hypothetical protein